MPKTRSPRPAYRSVCTSLRSIAKHEDVVQGIEQIVLNMSSLKRHAYHVLALYTFHLYKNDNVPEVTEELVLNILRVLCDVSQQTFGKPKRGKQKEETQVLQKELYEFIPPEGNKAISSVSCQSHRKLRIHSLWVQRLARKQSSQNSSLV